MPTAPLDTSTTSRPLWPQPGDAGDQPLQARQRQLDAVAGDHVRAELDHQPVRFTEGASGR
jgi:hypothetical protein